MVTNDFDRERERLLHITNEKKQLFYKVKALYMFFRHSGKMGLTLRLFYDLIVQLSISLLTIYVFGGMDWDKLIKKHRIDIFYSLDRSFLRLHPFFKVYVVGHFLVIIVYYVVYHKFFKRYAYVQAASRELARAGLKDEFSYFDLSNMSWPTFYKKVSPLLTYRDRDNRKVTLELHEANLLINRKINLYVPLMREVIDFYPENVVIEFSKATAKYFKRIVLKPLRRGWERNDITGVRKEIIVYSLISIAIIPYTLFHLTLLLLLKYGKELKENTYTPAIFSKKYYYILKLPVENKQQFFKRIAKFHFHSQQYLSQFRNRTVEAFLKIGRFILGGILTIFLLVTMVYDIDYLYKVNIYKDYSVGWFVGIVGIAYTAVKSQIPSRFDVFDPSEEFESLVKNLSYFPKDWVGNHEKEVVFKEIGSMFPSPLKNMLTEVVNIVYTPFYILIYYGLDKNSLYTNLVETFGRFADTESRGILFSNWGTLLFREDHLNIDPIEDEDEQRATSSGKVGLVYQPLSGRRGYLSRVPGFKEFYERNVVKKYIKWSTEMVKKRYSSGVKVETYQTTWN